jgi:circadian clock protein KaiC
MKRVPTGVPGLDRLTSGGLPEASTTLVAGAHGTGKTMMGLQFLYEGATRFNEPGLLIQIGGFSETILWYTEMLGWNIEPLQEKNRLVIYAFKPKDFDKFTPTKLSGEFLGKLRNIVSPLGVRRIVIDSITPLAYSMPRNEYQRAFYETLEFFKESAVTALVLAEAGKDSTTPQEFEDHMADNVISMRMRELPTGEWVREMRISKMVATNYPMGWYPINITERGFNVRPFL